jgi:hypothetical protein
MRLARIATVPLALTALAALSCSKSETSGTPVSLGAITCSSNDQSVCPPSNLVLGFNGSSGTPSITPVDNRTNISVSSSGYVVAGATSSATPGYWFDVVGGTLRAWGSIAVGATALRASAISGTAATDSTITYFAEVPLFCGQQSLVYRFDNGSGHSYWSANVTLTNCSTPLFRAQLIWDTYTNDSINSDIDLHLVRPNGATDTGNDCYYADCQGGGLDWGAAGSAGDPYLDVDNTVGYGPENITLTSGPEAGTYRVIVHNYSGVWATHATVKLYFNDVEVARYTSLALDYPNNEWWSVATVDIQNKVVTPVNTYSSAVPTVRGAQAVLEPPKK